MYRKLMALLIGVVMLGLVIGIAGCPKKLRDESGTLRGFPPPPPGLSGQRGGEVTPPAEKAPAEEAPAEEAPVEEAPAEESTAPY